MGAIVIRTRFDQGTESAEVATSGTASLFIISIIAIQCTIISDTKNICH